jgi:WD40 repeat protein
VTRNEHGRVTIWDVATRRKRTTLKQPSGGRPVAFSPDSRLLAIGRGKPWPEYSFLDVRVVDLATGTELATLDFGRLGTADLRFSPDGSILRSIAQEDGLEDPPPSQPWVVRTWDTTTWRELPADLIPIPQTWSRFDNVAAVSPDGRIVATSRLEAPDVRLWDAVTGANLATLPTPSTPPLTINWVREFSPDGRTLAVTRLKDRKNLLELWDVPTHSVRQTFRGLDAGAMVWFVRFVPGSSRSLVVSMTHYDFAKSPLGQVMHGVSRSLVPLPSDRLYPNEVVVWDLSSDGARARLKGENYCIVSPDGSILATAASENGPVTLWDLTPK